MLSQQTKESAAGTVCPLMAIVLWHARVGLFNNRLNKRNKTIFPLHLSNDLPKRLT